MKKHSKTAGKPMLRDKIIGLGERSIRKSYYLQLQRHLEEVEEVRQELAQSQARYRSLVENINDVIFSLDSEGVVTYISPVIHSLTGYQPEEVVGKSFKDFVFPEDLPSLTDSFEHALAGVLDPQEFRVQVKDGGFRQVRSSSRPLQENGRVVGLTGVMSDITERKQAEAELVFSEEKFSKAFYASPNLMAITRPEDGYIFDINESFSRFFGYAREECIGHSTAELRMWVDPAQRAFAIKQLEETGEALYMPVELRTKSGEIRSLIDSMVFIHINDQKYLLSVATDITERKHMEQDLIVRERDFRTLVENSSDPILRYDRDCKRVYVNPVIGRISGKPLESLIGYKPKDAQLLVDSEAEKLTQAIRRVFDKDQACHVDFGFIDLNGAHHDYDMLLVPEHDVDGQVMTVLGIAHDITERKQAERERQHHTDFLANMDRINRAIQKANDLEQMMSDVLGEVLAIFDCDRVSLVYPCDPDAASWSVPMERFKPEYPGVFASGMEMPMTPEVAAMHRASLECKQPLTIGAGTDFPFPASFQSYGDKTGIGMALFPKTGKPWGLAISQCSHEREWTPTELRLFEEIARRLADALSTLLVFRDLQDAQAVVENSSALLMRIKAQEGWAVEYVSDNVQKLIGYTSEELTSGRIPPENLIHPDDLEKLVRTMVEHREHDTGHFILEYRMVAKDGRVFWVEDRTSAIKDATGKVAHFESVIVDQTERRQAIERLRESLVGTIRAISLVVEKRDPYTAGHQNKVAKLSVAIGTELGWDEDRIEGLGLGAMIHDIGKIYVPAEILSRPGRLNDIEYALIKGHPQIGYEIVKDIKFPWPVAEMILQHHERLDGSGYPNGAKANEMIVEAKIIAVADVVEAMMSHRPYRPSKGIEPAMEEIESNRGIKYDPDVVDACLRLFRERDFVLE